MPSYRRTFPIGTKRITTGCQYCAVGCGYNAFLVPENANPQETDELDGVSALITPAMRGQLRYRGKSYAAAVAPDARCDLNKGNHSVRGGTQGDNLVSVDGADRSTEDRLKSPQVRLASGELEEITWSDLNRVMAKLVATATGMRLTGRGGSRRLQVDQPGALGGKVYEYQYLENTFAATQLFYSLMGTPNFAYHDRPSAAGSSPGVKDAGFRPHDFAYEDLADADVVLVLGTNPYENQSVFFMQHLAGRQLIVVDPRRTATAQYAEETGGLHLQPGKLGADSLLLYAMAREVLERYQARHGTFDMPLRLEIGDPEQLRQDAAAAGLGEGAKARRASRATDLAGFRGFLGFDSGDDTYTLANAARVAGVDAALLAEAVSRLFEPEADPERRPRVAILYEKGLIWGFNYHNTAAVASLGVLLGAVDGDGRLTGRVGGHQKGWAESREALAGVDGSNGEGYPFRHVEDTYTDPHLRKTFSEEATIQPHHNLDYHVFGPPADQIEARPGDGKVTLTNGVTTVAEPDVTLLWIVGGNYLGQTNDSQRKRRALERRLAVGGAADSVLRPTSADPEAIFEALKTRLESGGLVVVHQEIFRNPTTELADLVIPAAGWGEDTFCRYNAQRRLKLFERFQDMPLHGDDADRMGDGDPMDHVDDFTKSPKPDWMIFRDIGREIGRFVDEATPGDGSFATRVCADAFPWSHSFEVADAMAELSNRGRITARGDRPSMLGDLLPFAESQGLTAADGRLHSLLGWSRDGTGDALAEHLSEGYSVPGSGNRAHGNGVATNGVLLPAVGVRDDAGQVTRLEGTLRVARRGQEGGFFFVKAPWADIEADFARINGAANDEVMLTNGRFNHLWNNMFHHLRNETVNERYPEDLPGTVLEVDPDWATERGLVNGQVVDVSAGERTFRALISRQSSVAHGHAFAMFSYPVRNGEGFRFDGFVNNVTDGYTDGVNPIAALKYGRARLTAAAHPETGGRWVYSSAQRLGPTYEERSRIADTDRFDPRGDGPPPAAPARWSRRQRLDWQMREMIVTKGLPRAFLERHADPGATSKILDPDRFICQLATDPVEREFFLGALPFMNWPQGGGAVIDHWREDEIAFVKDRWAAEEDPIEIHEIRLLPPLAIARLGSSPEPMHNYDVLAPEDGGTHRRLEPAPTLLVEDGRITEEQTPAEVTFRDGQGRIKPVAPFFEVWARFSEDGLLEPLTAGHLERLGLVAADLTWRVDAANLKAFRRTGDPRDRIDASTGEFSDHDEKSLDGECEVFKPGKSLPLGHVRYLEPSEAFPGLRLRFTPAAGRVYGPRAGDPNLADDVYDGATGDWDNHADGDPGAPPPTSPGGIYRGRFNSQTRRFVSEGYLDDACDGVIEVSLEAGGRTLRSQARFTSGPPDFAPDSYHVRTLEDELEQMLQGPAVEEDVPWPEVTDLLRRAFETVSLMETRVMNGSPGVGGVAENRNNMAGHDSGAGRAFEPIFDAAVPGLTDPAAVGGFHRGALASLEAGNLPTYLDLLRSFDQAHDLTDRNRRRMPAMMRGSDGGHLALTRRQRDKVRAAAEDRVTDRPGQNPGGGATPEEEMELLIGHFESRAGSHQGLDAGNGQRVSELFGDPAAFLDFLQRGVAQGFLAGPEAGRPLVVPGNPDDSALVRLLRRPGHPMNGPFSRVVPGTERTGLQIVERWIQSLT